MIVKDSSQNLGKPKKKLNALLENLEKKEFILHFLPSFFDDIIDKKKIPYKGVNLKVDYLVNIVSDLIAKYNFNKRNGFPLSSVIHKERYGMNYNYYIEYLLEHNVINLDKNYLVNSNCKIFSLKNHILDQKLKRYKNRDKIILKKYKKRMLSRQLGSINNPIEHEIKQKLLNDLVSIDIDFERSVEFLNKLKNNNGFRIYNKNIHAIESIKDKDIFYTFDEYGRMHTNFTVLRSFIRKNCLTIDNKVLREIDISNSQPLFLAKLIQESNTSWVDKDEFNSFKTLTKSGKYYDHIMNRLGIKKRSVVKDMTYKVLFGENRVYKNKKTGRTFMTKYNEDFKMLFPTIFNFITLYKSQFKNYKVLSYELQRMESEVIYNKIVKRVMMKNSEIKMFTVHDSIVVTEDHYDLVNDIFQKTLLSEFDF